MRINQLLAELTGDYEAFGEWPYFVSIFGHPGGDEPWGWQIDGHHLCINTMVFDGRIVMTPTFMGAEPRRIHGRFVAPESRCSTRRSRLGLALMRSLDTAQRERAIIHPSIHPDDIPPQLQNLFDGRMQAGAFHDNLVAPYQGVAGVDMSDAQRRLLLELAGTYVGWSDDPSRRGPACAEVESHLDETWFSWYGGYDDEAPVLLPGPQPGDPDRVRPPPRCRARQRGADPPPRAHRRAHAQRRRLRRRPTAPAPRTVRPPRRRPPPRTERVTSAASGNRRR